MRWKTLPVSHLQKLVDANKRVFVLNTSALPSGDKGMIMVDFADGSSKRKQYIKFPPTFIPICASDVVSGEKLLSSPDFKETLIKGMLTLVDPDQAENYLLQPEALEEYESLTLSEHSMKSQRLSMEQAVSKRVRIAHNSNESQGPQQDVSAVDTVSNKVRGYIESMLSKETAPRDVMINLRRHQSALSAADLSYVMANSTDADLSKWAQKALAEISIVGGSEEPEVKVTPVKRVTAKKAAKDAAFDFDDKADEMTAEEKAADAAARRKYAGQQDTEGRGKAQEEINKLLAGAK